MLEEHYSQQLEILLERIQAAIVLPDSWGDFFERQGLLPTVADERRQFPRRYRREEAICEFQQSLPAIERRHGFSKIFLKDVSRSGISFVASFQFFPGEQVRLWTQNGIHACSIVRCTKHNDRCYELGAELATVEPPLPLSVTGQRTSTSYHPNRSPSGTIAS